ncbi:hypothetical protein NXW13_00850 [Bacteroides thetaiotaomicron]|nr:hypothetical protein [Bacteroides thetaiotaomicron]
MEDISYFFQEGKNGFRQLDTVQMLVFIHEFKIAARYQGTPNAFQE